MKKTIERIIAEVEALHPYENPPYRNRYGSYNQGWTDACDLIEEQLLKELKL